MTKLKYHLFRTYTDVHRTEILPHSLHMVLAMQHRQKTGLGFSIGFIYSKHTKFNNVESNSSFVEF